MTNVDVTQLSDGASESLKYARIEKERKFLLNKPISHANEDRCRRIQDRYLIGTKLRLRSVEEVGVETIFKLGQKTRLTGDSPRTIAHTTMYISSAEFELLAQIPANVLAKVRWLKKIGELTLAVDEFSGILTGLVLAELDSEEMGKLSNPLPEFLSEEVTDDERFTGGLLATTTAPELANLLGSFRINI